MKVTSPLFLIFAPLLFIVSCRQNKTTGTSNLQEQVQALAMAAPLVKPGGRLMYVTCSVLPEENEDQVAAFVAAHPQFQPEAFKATHLPAYVRGKALQFTPLKTGCDGFFVAALRRAG